MNKEDIDRGLKTPSGHQFFPDLTFKTFVAQKKQEEDAAKYRKWRKNRLRDVLQIAISCLIIGYMIHGIIHNI